MCHQGPIFWLAMIVALFGATFSSLQLLSLSGGEFTLPVILGFAAIFAMTYIYSSSVLNKNKEGFRDSQIFLRRSTVDGWSEKTTGSIYGPSQTLEGEILSEGEQYSPEGDTSWSTSGFPWYTSAY